MNFCNSGDINMRFNAYASCIFLSFINFLGSAEYMYV
jgi:hypothetical protein